MVAADDTFGESGKPEELLKKYNLDVTDIIGAAEKSMERKK
jgi:transketolase